MPVPGAIARTVVSTLPAAMPVFAFALGHRDGCGGDRDGCTSYRKPVSLKRSGAPGFVQLRDFRRPAG